MPPMLAAAVRASLEVMRTEPWRRERLREHAALLRRRLRELPWALLESITAIQPVIVGDNALVMRLMDQLWERGFWVPAIRPPTVPDGSARLRVSLSAAHTTEQVAALADALEAVAQAELATV
jgi:8-amino-7-oxononanoate synthase